MIRIKLIICFFLNIFCADGALHSLDIVDTAGSDEFPAMRHHSLMSGDGFIVVFALDDRPSYDEALRLIQLIINTKGKYHNFCVVDSKFPI